MGYSTIFENMIEEKLMSLHTAYLAKVVSTNGTTAKIQPLGNVKAYGNVAKKQSPLSNVPILKQARYKVTPKQITYVYSVSNHTGHTKTETVAALTPISAGDIVLCVCCERDITDAKRGVNSTPVIGHHNLSDSIIVGVL